MAKKATLGRLKPNSSCKTTNRFLFWDILLLKKVGIRKN
jgi:hypothetical protein